MNERLRLLAILAHPDDESLGVGPILARYAADGVETYLLTATRGQRGRFFNNENRPSDDEVGRVREGELHAAARVLGLHDVALLDYRDGELDRADPVEAIARIAAHVRRVRPHVVVTFDPFGAYGHPDHVAISQLATAAIVVAAQPQHDAPSEAGAHAVSKLYYIVLGPEQWATHEAAFKRLVSHVDGVERRVTPWPDWSITTRIDTHDQRETTWRAIACHQTQLAGYGHPQADTSAAHAALWTFQTFYRVFSTVNGGRRLEADLFEGLR